MELWKRLKDAWEKAEAEVAKLKEGVIDPSAPDAICGPYCDDLCGIANRLKEENEGLIAELGKCRWHKAHEEADDEINRLNCDLQETQQAAESYEMLYGKEIEKVRRLEAEVEKLKDDWTAANGIAHRAEDELSRLRESLEENQKLVRRASEDSTITTSDNPGCFFCDHEEHTDDCPVPYALNPGEGEVQDLVDQHNADIAGWDKPQAEIEDDFERLQEQAEIAHLERKHKKRPDHGRRVMGADKVGREPCVCGWSDRSECYWHRHNSGDGLPNGNGHLGWEKTDD